VVSKAFKRPLATAHPGPAATISFATPPDDDMMISIYFVRSSLVTEIVKQNKTPSVRAARLPLSLQCRQTIGPASTAKAKQRENLDRTWICAEILNVGLLMDGGAKLPVVSCCTCEKTDDISAVSSEQDEAKFVRATS
jgi:hypothetical protein